MNKSGLSIVIPTYNEKDNISKILEKLKKSLKGITYEIIFVDDNSPDGTSFEIKNFIKTSSKIHLIHRVGRRGLSGAIIEGIFAARSELVAVMDCDLQHDETKLINMLDLFSKDASLDIVIGSRFTTDGEISTPQGQIPLSRLVDGQYNGLFKMSKDDNKLLETLFVYQRPDGSDWRIPFIRCATNHSYNQQTKKLKVPN